MNKEIMVFIEISEGKLANTSKGIFTIALSLAKEKNWIVSALIAGKNIENVTKEIFSLGASKVYVYDHEELQHYRCLPYSRILIQTIVEHKPEVLLFGYSTTSTDFVPRVSALQNNACITGAKNLEWDGDVLTITKTIYTDKLDMKFVIKGHPKMVIVDLGVYPSPKPDNNLTGDIIQCTPVFKDEDLTEEILNVDFVKKTVDLSEAKLIVSGGRGVGSKEDFKLIFDAADSLGGNAACTRAVWDAGWLETDLHVGQTGQSVSPDIYIAAGISGAVQHTAGIKQSKTILVINTDPDAPIWSVANYGIVGDLRKVLPVLIQKAKG